MIKKILFFIIVISFCGICQIKEINLKDFRDKEFNLLNEITNFMLQEESMKKDTINIVAISIHPTTNNKVNVFNNDEINSIITNNIEGLYKINFLVSHTNSYFLFFYDSKIKLISRLECCDLIKEWFNYVELNNVSVGELNKISNIIMLQIFYGINNTGIETIEEYNKE